MSSHPHCGQCSHWSRFLGTGLGRCSYHERTSSCVHRCSDFVDCLTLIPSRMDVPSEVSTPMLARSSTLAIVRVQRSGVPQPIPV